MASNIISIIIVIIAVLFIADSIKYLVKCSRLKKGAVQVTAKILSAKKNIRHQRRTSSIYFDIMYEFELDGRKYTGSTVVPERFSNPNIDYSNIMDPQYTAKTIELLINPMEPDFIIAEHEIKEKKRYILLFVLVLIGLVVFELAPLLGFEQS
ncbi:MAG: hypothetical protein Q4E57_09305 [Eubacteriales bacterium]|nr:hypothetical protein [Eubacteriales bacterium]